MSLRKNRRVCFGRALRPRHGGRMGPGWLSLISVESINLNLDLTGCTSHAWGGPGTCLGHADKMGLSERLGCVLMSATQPSIAYYLVSTSNFLSCTLAYRLALFWSHTTIENCIESYKSVVTFLLHLRYSPLMNFRNNPAKNGTFNFCDYFTVSYAFPISKVGCLVLPWHKQRHLINFPSRISISSFRITGCKGQHASIKCHQQI